MHHVGIIQNCGLPGIDLLLSFSVPGWGKGGWGAEIIAGWIWGLADLLGGSKYLGCDNITSQIFFVNHGSQHSTFFGKISSYPSRAAGPKPMIPWPYKNN